ncbi:LADA_0H19416g1_1 [Lachancea dasiensis]|uniref:LADA_0H19416g1_1 n=1 Tax=Lachancea dasiensis TaxID=1072105 RepID=A0A1G4K6B6_9SACH|nr:LADA_0H19416g1_1 [Lachancea dasiensis]
MKFGKHLETRQLVLPEYNGHFIDYKGLKKLIKQLSAPPSVGFGLPDSGAGVNTGAVGSGAETGASGDAGSSAEQSRIHQTLQEHKASFFFKLERELEKVNEYYLEKESDLRIKFDILQSRYQDGVKRGKLTSKTTVSFKHLRDGAKKFERDLAHLEQFVELNRTGFSKVLKKWDKRSHSHTKDFYLATVVSAQPFFTRNETSKLNDEISVILLDLEEVSTRDDVFSYAAPFASKSATKLAELDANSASQIHTNAQRLPIGSIIPPPQMDVDTLDISMEIETWYLEVLNIARLKDEEPRVRLLRQFATEKIQNFVEDHVPQSRIDKKVILRDALTKVFVLLVSSNIDDDSLKVFMKAADLNIDLTFVEEDEVVFSKRNIIHEAAGCETQSRSFVLQEAFQQCRDSVVPEDILRKLLNAQDANGSTPLHYACNFEKEEFVELLINSTFLESVDVVDNDSKTPLLLSVAKHCTNITKLLLLSAYASPSPQAEALSKPQFAPLNVACAYKNYEAAKLILEFSNVNLTAVRDTQGRCPLHIVAKNGGDAKMITLLVSHGADPNGVDGFNGWAPIFYAIQEGHRSTVEELLKNGARIDVMDEDNLSPFFYALWEGHLSVLNLLQGYRPEGTAEQDIFSKNLGSILEPADDLSLEDSLHGIPDFTLPPPIIPLRKYGHNFLEKKIFVKISFLRGTSSIVLNKEDEMALSSPGRVTLNSNVLDIIPRNVILSTEDDEENSVVFQVDSLEGFCMDFEIFPSFGTRMIAKTTAVPTLFKQFQSGPFGKGNFVLPLYDGRMKNVGELNLDYRLVFPYSGRPLEITKYETYWKSTTGNEAGKSGHHFVTSSSLSGAYTNFFVSTLNDGTLVVSPNKTITVGPMNLKLLDLNANQLEQLVGYPIGYIDDQLNSTAFEDLLASRFTTLDCLLERAPANSKLEIEVCFPTECEFSSVPLKLSPHVNINSFIDKILTSLFTHVRHRFHNGFTSSMVFTSRNPEVCSILNWKQPNFPVLFYMNGLRKENGLLVKDTPHHLSHLSLSPETVDFSDPCSRSIREVVQFASHNNLLGIIVPLELLRASQQLIGEIRSRGLLLIGSLLDGETRPADLQELDINGIRGRNFLDFKGSIDM